MVPHEVTWSLTVSHSSEHADTSWRRVICQLADAAKGRTSDAEADTTRAMGRRIEQRISGQDDGGERKEDAAIVSVLLYTYCDCCIAPIHSDERAYVHTVSSVLVAQNNGATCSVEDPRLTDIRP